MLIYLMINKTLTIILLLFYLVRNFKKIYKFAFKSFFLKIKKSFSQVLLSQLYTIIKFKKAK